jgi:hypothetical protein
LFVIGSFSINIYARHDLVHSFKKMTSEKPHSSPRHDRSKMSSSTSCSWF